MGKVKLKNRANNRGQARNQAIKSVITKLIPTDWDELVWDIAESIISDTASNAIDNALYGEDEMSYTEVQNNYVHNTYVTQKTVVNSPIVPQIFPPKYNYRNSTSVWRSPPPINIPEPILPTDIDNQTPTQTSIGTSINVGTAVQNDRYKMGKLIFHPASTQKKVIRRKVPQNFLAFEYQNAQTEAINVISKLKNGEPTPIEYSGWLVASKNLAGLKDDGHILMGINSLSALAQTYRALSSIATIEPTNEIPIEYEAIDIDDKFTTLKFAGTSEYMPPDDLASKLGYEENDFKGKTIEDIIKDFGEKIYQNKQVTSLNDKVLNEINDNFDTPEKFITGIVAALFYRNGLHRLPGQLPESLSFDTNKYKNASDQPSIFIEDMMEYQQYLIKNLDEIFGRFPINFKYKSKDENGNDVEIPISFDNIAECLLEMSGLIMDINNTTDVLTNIGLKNLNEGIRASNGGFLSIDMLKIILDYLGCDYEEYFNKRSIPITQDATSFPEFLKETEVDRLSVRNKEKDTLKTALNTILLNTTIAKLALGQKKEFITGDAIRDQMANKRAKQDEQWEELIKEYTRLNSPTPTDPLAKFPKAHIKDRPPSIKKTTP